MISVRVRNHISGGDDWQQSQALVHGSRLKQSTSVTIQQNCGYLAEDRAMRAACT